MQQITNAEELDKQYGIDKTLTLDGYLHTTICNTLKIDKTKLSLSVIRDGRTNEERIKSPLISVDHDGHSGFRRSQNILTVFLHHPHLQP
jgi:hypothetical protein